MKWAFWPAEAPARAFPGVDCGADSRHPVVMMIKLLRGLSLLAALWLLGACAGGKAPTVAEPPLRDARALPLFGPGGSAADFDALVSACSEAQAVIVGEIHGHPQGLDFAAALWEGIADRTPSAALSMEFFERDHQAGLDDYIAGITDEAAFRKATARTEGGYPPGHRRMVEHAKASGRPVIAANAPRRYVRIARLEGYERLAMLTSEQRRLFEAPEAMPSEAYRERFMALMGGAAADPSHAAPAGGTAPQPDPEEMQRTLEGFYRSQVLWDSTMAASIDGAIGAGLSPVVHIVGGFHVEKDGATVELLRHRRPEAAIVTILVVDAEGPSLRAEDQGKADYIVYAGPSPAP
jgi:uncharacterized iron-regulated protein